MKWLIASDIHGSDYYCERLVAAFHREAPTASLFPLSNRE